VSIVDGRGSARSAPAQAVTGRDVTNRLTEIVLDRISGGQVDLPALPGPTIRCIDLARQGRLSFSDAANIINESPALRSRVMKLANSAAFPSLMPATTLDLAIARLGTQGLYTALIEFATREVLEGRQPRIKEAMRRIWPHALGTATMTAELCQVQGQGGQSANGYLAGLLANIGRPVVGTLLLEIERQMQRAESRSSIPEAAFLAIMEGTAALAGAAVALRWELSGAVVEAITHSRSWNARDPKSLSNAVRFAGLATGRLGLTVGMHNGAESDRAFGEGRVLLKVDEVALKRISHGFKERMTVLAGIRG
jgi:HD-like signal output (HDOD) protein